MGSGAEARTTGVNPVADCSLMLVVNFFERRLQARRVHQFNSVSGRVADVD